VIEFRLLGEIEARIEGVALDLGHARQRCVLVALLLDANRVVHADQLLERVWGGNRARESLYSYLSRLRQALPDVPITRRSGGYVLCVDPDQVDVHRFRRLAGQARAAGDARLFDEALSIAICGRGSAAVRSSSAGDQTGRRPVTTSSNMDSRAPCRPAA
jgi:DNA-binding SARP family transcriptional activator